MILRRGLDGAWTCFTDGLDGGLRLDAEFDQLPRCDGAGAA